MYRCLLLWRLDKRRAADCVINVYRWVTGRFTRNSFASPTARLFNFSMNF